MSKPKSTRIQSIDILRGLVMVLMALDHTRDYFHLGASMNNPTDLETTTPILFFTRFITHYCAPVFVFLAGTSAYLYGSNKTKPQLFKFLFTRGLWLVFLEIFVNSLNWTFDLTYSFIGLQVIWAIGIGMIVLSFIILLPKKVILITGIILVAGHNMLDSITMQGNSLKSILWYMLHQPNVIPISQTRFAFVAYPVIPWIGLIALGYCFGSLYTRGFLKEIRKKWLLRLGICSVLLFFIIRGVNLYGDLNPWSVQDTLGKTVMSFFKVTKYPPSLCYLLITIGPSLLFLYAIEKANNKITDFFLVFGRVPLFYYFLHIFVIHSFAILGVILLNDNWQEILSNSTGRPILTLAKQGYSLFVVYVMWIFIVTLLYFPSKKYMIYKTNNKKKWWLSYL
ncbi:DUF1624 domain-containing protein [Seonamhaeicola maritimus]|uniref:DUF1624 domain-containing protein n=1 Tax=Seonamhaeicola maritimus TaxID=2591822 RepID=A0A5C7GL12_9FLAO|nr:heparan-alpha-glucosaminide N-acetyltransferase domain-containing protein [Seonamhaeicola maritimus]TXG39179.1 DUF1624 domain-containing protein [Seonamhaeicola maritimus]